jgi:peptidoglycan LD-endopeptidase LytH
MFAVRNAPIVAPEAGIIKYDYNRLGGVIIQLAGEGRNRYYFAHLEDWATLLVTSGDRVEAGWVIGYVGNSGNAKGTSPHLHIEVRVDGIKRNPYPWVDQACNNKANTIPMPQYTRWRPI